MKKIFQFLESRVLKIELFLQGRKQQRGWSEKGGNRYGSLKCECSSENVEIWCAIFFAISLNYSSEPSWFGAVKKKKTLHDKYSFFPGNGLGNDAYFVQEKKDAELLYSLLDKKMGSAPYVNLLCWHKSKPVTTPDWSTNWCSVSFSI